jgi:hypothetical protein
MLDLFLVPLGQILLGLAIASEGRIITVPFAWGAAVVVSVLGTIAMPLLLLGSVDELPALGWWAGIFAGLCAFSGSHRLGAAFESAAAASGVVCVVALLVLAWRRLTVGGGR